MEQRSLNGVEVRGHWGSDAENPLEPGSHGFPVLSLQRAVERPHHGEGVDVAQGTATSVAEAVAFEII